MINLNDFIYCIINYRIKSLTSSLINKFYRSNYVTRLNFRKLSKLNRYYINSMIEERENYSSCSLNSTPRKTFSSQTLSKSNNSRKIHLSMSPVPIRNKSETKEREQKTRRTYHVKNNKLSCFDQNYHILVNQLKKNIDNENVQRCSHVKRAFTSKTFGSGLKTLTLSYGFSVEEIGSFTNSERISDFYEYTEECMKMIHEMKEKPNMKNKKVKIPKSNNKKLALFDLDETLVHCTGNITNNQNYQHEVEVTLPLGKKVKIGINVRPHMKQALDMLKQYYTLVIFTASHQSYTDAVMELIDPNRVYFEYRLYRNNCLPTKIDGKDFFIKDLSIIENYSLNEMVIIDNSVLSFAYHIDNGIPIVPYYEGEEDSELPILAYYLKSIYNKKNLREENKSHIKLDSFLSNDSQTSLEDDRQTSDGDEYSQETQAVTFPSIYINNKPIKEGRRNSNSIAFKDVYYCYRKEFKK